MIKVFFDHQKFSTQKYGGITRYFSYIINGIKENPDFSYKIGCLNSPNHYIKSEKLLLNNLLGNTVFDSNFRSVLYKLNQQYCTFLLKNSDFDVIHPTYYDPYFIASNKKKKPVVVTIHDMTHERLPQYFWSQDALTYNKKMNIQSADRLIAISQTTKSDLIEFSNVNPDHIEVIYHGIDTQSPLAIDPVHNIPENYLLFVGDRGGYKNFHLFIKAFSLIVDKHPDLKILLAGGGKMGIADLEFIRQLKLESKIVHIDVTDEQLNYLYKNALLFIYPSLYEGFGLPILESFKAGCPILLSDIPCFREIAGVAADFFNPYDLDHLISRLEYLIESKETRSKLVNNGLSRVLDFPINKSIDQTLNIYRELIGI
jgi:glycosyltransferase involved in cell wall biosynthesis